MPENAERLSWGDGPDWQARTEELISSLRERSRAEPVWNPHPVNFAVDIGPSNPFQETLLAEMGEILSSRALGGTTMAVPDRKTQSELLPNMIVMFGDGQLDARVNTIPTYLRLPSPKPPFLLINTADRLPRVDFDLSRRQLVAGACNNGAVFEGERNGSVSSGALWASMQGNHQHLRKPHADIIDDVVKRILAHYGTEYVIYKHRLTPAAEFTWNDWARSPIHQELAEAAWTLGSAGVIQNKVVLTQYYDDRTHTLAIQRALNKSLGESMRAQYDPTLRVMGITVSGGGKVEVSADPHDAHLVPVTHITRDGYASTNPRGAESIRYGNGSVETHESGKIILFGALALSGIARTYREAQDWLNDRLAKNGAVDIVPEDLSPMITVIDHSHWHVEDYNDERVEVVSPDPRYYPPDLDFACGSLDSANATASALFRSDIFRDPGPSEDPMKGKILVVELPGHGLIAMGTNRRQVTEALTDDRIMTLRPPRWV